MQRLWVRKQLPVFRDAEWMFNALYSTTYETDENTVLLIIKILLVMKYVQTNDLTVDGAMTDPKGDRGLAPSEQQDPDLYLRIVERRKDGIIVRGAKAHQTGAVNSHEHLIMPTCSMREEDKDYAVAFSVPSDAPGVFMIYGRQSCDTRKLENSSIDVGNSTYGGHEALVVFDDVFVPNDRIFLCGEYDFAGMLVERFAGYHRRSTEDGSWSWRRSDRTGHCSRL